MNLLHQALSEVIHFPKLYKSRLIYTSRLNAVIAKKQILRLPAGALIRCTASSPARVMHFLNHALPQVIQFPETYKSQSIQISDSYIPEVDQRALDTTLRLRADTPRHYSRTRVMQLPFHAFPDSYTFQIYTMPSFVSC